MERPRDVERDADHGRAGWARAHGPGTGRRRLTSAGWACSWPWSIMAASPAPPRRCTSRSRPCRRLSPNWKPSSAVRCFTG